MSKVNPEQALIELETGVINKKSEMLMQVLALLESLKTRAKGKMARISPELTEIFNDEKKFERVRRSKNLDELLGIIESFDLDHKMLKIHCIEQLRKDFPILAKKDFL